MSEKKEDLDLTGFFKYSDSNKRTENLPFSGVIIEDKVYGVCGVDFTRKIDTESLGSVDNAELSFNLVRILKKDEL